MEKFFGFFTKRREKKGTLSEIPFDPCSVQVYRNYEFDSGNSLVKSADAFDFDFESKLQNGLNTSEHRCKASGAQDVFSSDKADKARKTMYVLNIRNCKCFHVGPQKTINITSGRNNEKGWSLEVDLNFLLDCCQRISEESIMVISLNMGNNWKKFGICLGLKEIDLEELKCRNDENTIFMTFDILQKYMGLFPNTSVGFIVNILNDIQQMKIIREIAKNFKS